VWEPTGETLKKLNDFNKSEAERNRNNLKEVVIFLEGMLRTNDMNLPLTRSHVTSLRKAIVDIKDPA
jgi:hypothetical protein